MVPWVCFPFNQKQKVFHGERWGVGPESQYYEAACSLGFRRSAVTGGGLLRLKRIKIIMYVLWKNPGQVVYYSSHFIGCTPWQEEQWEL